jgi:hypothetical protein
MSQGAVNVVASGAHLFGVVRPRVALYLQHEIDYVGDAGVSISVE